MALKAILATLDGVPDALKTLYVQQDGKFVLELEGDVPGYVPVQRHAEFRDNNVRLLKAMGVTSVDDALHRAAIIAGIDPAKLERLKAIDPDEYAALKAKAEDLKKKGVDKPDDLQAAINAAVAAAIGPVKQELDSVKAERQRAQERLADQSLRTVVGERFVKAGGKLSATDFIVDRAKQAFKVVDEKIVAAEGKYDKDGNPLTVEQWILAASKEYDFAFEPSKGGGAAPAGAGTPTPHTGPLRTKDGVELKTDGISVL